jgi:hypothetical protein
VRCEEEGNQGEAEEKKTKGKLTREKRPREIKRIEEKKEGNEMRVHRIHFNLGVQRSALMPSEQIRSGIVD